MGSKRLPGKVLMEVKGKSLLRIAIGNAFSAFGAANVVVAYPNTQENMPIRDEAEEWGAIPFGWAGPEADVLGRFYACASLHRWHPESVIFRYTPDDFRKSVRAMQAVADGARLPVEWGGEAFTLGQLQHAHATVTDPHDREHITYALFSMALPPMQEGLWSIDTLEDWERANAL